MRSKIAPVALAFLGAVAIVVVLAVTTSFTAAPQTPPQPQKREARKDDLCVDVGETPEGWKIYYVKRVISRGVAEHDVEGFVVVPPGKKAE